ncbi:flagellar assembly protein FliH [Pseudogracilibacillus auburnensis]|uniref:flagellar assembly protein FliH n=1 Tax=Pseudogracilibacillus auburnensis TaxID=1494959 RepID=UPI0013148927|nr:flagellar assembly protein FliH [Pseudogracilibacillus auburnensis]
MSKTMDQNKMHHNHKVISIKKMTNMNRHKTDFDELNMDEQHATIQVEIEKAKQQLATLQEQKEKMLNDMKEAIKKEKEVWLKEKEIERQKAEKIGYGIGYDKGQENAEQEYEKLLTQANEIVSKAKHDYEQTIEKHQQAIIQLAISAAEKIINDQISKNQDYFTAIVVKAMDELKDKSTIAIYVSPHDYTFICQQKEELEQILEEGELLSIYVDQHLHQGDCVIRHPFGQINVGIDLQLQQLKNALEENVTEN